jgi:hypothetical protein
MKSDASSFTKPHYQPNTLINLKHILLLIHIASDTKLEEDGLSP